MSLFTADTHFVVYMNAKDPTPSQELHSRDALAAVFADLNKYDATTHFVRTEHDIHASSVGRAFCGRRTASWPSRRSGGQIRRYSRRAQKQRIISVCEGS
jgi:hypothetical protein